MWHKYWALAAIAWSAPDCKAQEILSFRNVRIFDGSRVIERGSVVVEAGKIVRAGVGVSDRHATQVVEGKGKTLLPGLIDAHTHVALPAALDAAIVFGVTAELDMFSDPRQFASIREMAARRDRPPRSDMYSAGLLATAPNGHGTQFGSFVSAIASPAEAPAFVDARIREGSDYIKIVYGNGSGGRPKMSAATLQALVNETRRRGKLSVVHVQTLDEAGEAIRAGADGLAHVSSDRVPDAGWFETLDGRRPFIVATLTVLESAFGAPDAAAWLDAPGIGPYLTEQQRQRLAAKFTTRPAAGSFAVAKESVAAFRRAGFPILAGTDAPNPGTAHGASLHRELELLVEAGLTPAEALRSATSTPASSFRLADRGRIAAGMRADLLLVEGNPLRDITATRRIAGVWKDGRPVPRLRTDAVAASRMEQP